MCANFCAPTGDGNGRGRRSLRRSTAAFLTSGLLLAGALTGLGAGTARADDGVRPQDGALATLDGLKTFDRAVVRAKGRSHSIPAGLFEMTVEGGGRLKTYGVDLHDPAQDQARYRETPWRQTALGARREAGRIHWILRNSYPQVDDLTRLAEAAGTGPLTPRTAAAGTQVAIWRYSDGADVVALDPAAEKLADWLERRARPGTEPRASVALEPSAVAGRPGTRIGPVTVRTGAERVSLAPAPAAAADGVEVTDAAGKPVTSVADGARVYIRVPSGARDGSAALTAQTATSVPVGRALTSATGSQAQILAHSSESTVTAQTLAVWAEKGPIPALSARHDCAASQVEITAANADTAPFTFTLADAEHTVPARGSRTVRLPAVEDQPYEVPITGADGFRKSFRGVLDCRTAGAAVPAPSATAPGSGTGSAAEPGTGGPSPMTVPRLAPASADTAPALPDEDLAATGSTGITPLIAGGAAVLMAIGGGVLFTLRRKEPRAAGAERRDPTWE
ncbi:TQXA domain-containing protein [Streptomyces clavuligerus]|uniref:Putative sortase-sorted protein n=2 Tax=Streptomyces clavuligerus TaxID=1901 RepID=E2Q3V5_STRCL|nr:thioester domain-containing protein [Streptomyces clavuligerus]ANW20165.1 peptidase [Streptomyces clavuligerus]AXU14792.1 TQXA domain-containing protein [Streptomyces clavuligerus]EFG06925.1 putative sortase-sorted protein [Streptomyces clavuligerus]MBY6304822.1 TQXA domain-containing protein [Streptomyces clavuligerus]QCS07561.1 TQXA domain-containing protein [Streptomyces clavuligerus]